MISTRDNYLMPGLFSNEQYKRNKSNSTRRKYGPFRNFSDIYFLNICAHVLFVASNFSHNAYRRLIVERKRERKRGREREKEILFAI